MYPDRASLAYKVDHVGVSVAVAAPAFEFCRDELGLPVAWPFAGYGPVRTGGVGLGNLNLELLEPSPLLSPREPAAVGLVAFQPAPSSVDELVATLASRGVGHQGPLTIVEGIFGFTNVLVQGMGFDLTFFCAYHYPGSHDNAVRAAELSAADGGPLGLRGVSELRAAVDVDACTAILGPPACGTWRFDTGPDLVADASIEAGSAQMTWAVRDVAAAEQALINLGAQPVGDLFRIGQLGGLAIHLTSASPRTVARPAERRRARGGIGPELLTHRLYGRGRPWGHDPATPLATSGGPRRRLGSPRLPERLPARADLGRAGERATRCWIGADARPGLSPSTCGNCPTLDDHPDLRGH